MCMQVQAIGHGPFYPKKTSETLLLIIVMLFGMIWNIWFFYALTGGWWADRTQTVCDFEDQMDIIETYIEIAKQSANAEKIKR